MSKRTASSWPVITAVISASGTATVTVAGVEHDVDGTDVDEVRAGVVGLVTSQARALGRPVEASVEDPDGLFALIVTPSGEVRDAGAKSGRGRLHPVRVSTSPTDREGAGRSGVVPPTAPASAPRPPAVEMAGVSDASAEAGQVGLVGVDAGEARARLLRRSRAVIAVPVVVAAAAGLAHLAGVDRRVGPDAAVAFATASSVAGPDLLLEQARALQAVRAARELAVAEEVLTRSEALVSAELRDRLVAAVAATRSQITADASGATLQLSTRAVNGLRVEVEAQMATALAAAQAQAEAQVAAQAAAAAAAQAQAAAAAQAAASTRSSGQASQQPAAAAQGGAERSMSLDAEVDPGMGTATITIRVTTSGMSAPASAVIGGQGVPLSSIAVSGDTETFRGSVSGLPAGRVSWTATAGSKSIGGEVTVG